MPEAFDAILIGAGQAAPSLAARLVREGMRIAFVERNRFGGTCVNTGCIPTKTLVASARTAHVARRAADFGVELAGPVRVDMQKVKARKDTVVRASSEGVENGLRGLKDAAIIHDHARFESDHVIRVGDRQLTAPRIFLDVGGRASVPPIPGLRGVPFLTNSTMMDVDFLPQHLVILGGSYIALEFAQMYRRFGSEVTVIERSDRIVSREDQDVSVALSEILESEGVRIHTSAAISEIEKRGESVHVAWNGGEANGSHLLVALGRMPNTDDLGLENTGIKRDQHGFIEVNDVLETSVPGIWAMGDCTGKSAFTHTSYNDFEIVAANLFDHDPRKVSDRITAYNIYTDPPLGRCGMTEREVRATGRPALMGKRAMTRVSRAVEKGETAGFLKVLVDAENKQILGAALLGVECDEVIHCILDLMYARQPASVLQRAVHIHPTVSELLPTLMGELQPL